MALIVTPGASNADSYATLAEANTYITDRRVPTITWWNTAADDAKEDALRFAAVLLDRIFKWTGAAVDNVQARAWPRTGMLTRNGFEIPSMGATSIVTDLKDAQIEFALQLGVGDRISDNDALKQGITSVKAGSVAVTFGSIGISASSPEMLDAQLRLQGSELAYLAKVVPDAVRWMLVPSWYEEKTIHRGILFEAF